MYGWLKTIVLPKKKYIVQQKISLARIQNGPFDIKVMVQEEEILRIGK